MWCVRVAGAGRESLCRWPFGGRAGDGQDHGAPGASHSLAFMTELVEAQHWRCPWCGDCLPDSPRGTAIDHIIPRVYGGPHRRWNLQLLHRECNSAKGEKITAGALELAGAHGVTISMDIGHYRAGVRRRAAVYAVRAIFQLDRQARDRAVAAARNLTVFFPEAKVRAVIEGSGPGQPARRMTRSPPGPSASSQPHADKRTRFARGAALARGRCLFLLLVLPGSSRDVGGEDISGMPVQDGAGPVVAHGGPRVGARPLPARPAAAPAVRPAPCRSSRRPSPARKIGPSVRSPIARSMARGPRRQHGT